MQGGGFDQNSLFLVTQDVEERFLGKINGTHLLHLALTLLLIF